MSEHDKKRFEKMLAFHSAPTLLRVKCANLFAVDQNDFRLRELENLFKSKIEFSGLKIRFLCKCKSRVLAYVYCEELLKIVLKDTQTSAFLEDCGYNKDMSVDEMLTVLESRITCGSFPHEIGVFLGYPIEDVLGFIKNNGENFLFCGFWKVYSDPDGARMKFDKYVYCRNFLCNKISQGHDIYQALKAYKEDL